MPTDDMTEEERAKVMSEYMRKIGEKGKKSRWSKMSKKQRSQWGKKLAQAKRNKKKEA